MIQSFFLAQILLQFANAVIVFQMFCLVNHGNRWVYLAAGFALMGMRRITALVGYEIPNPTISLIDKLVLPFVITCLIYYGLRQLYAMVKREHQTRVSLEDEIDGIRDGMADIQRRFALHEYE